MGISREKLTAMLDVLKTRWQTKGWHVMAKEDSEPMAVEFIRELDRHSVPYQHYRELYNRAIDLRAARINNGLSCDDFSVEMMLACWPSLQRDIRQREIDSGRLLTETSQTQCGRCFGTGMERVYEMGVMIGLRKGCKHEILDDASAGPDDLPTMGRDETAIEICGRIKKELAQEWIAAIDDPSRSAAIWAAQGTVTRASRYIAEKES